MGIGKAGESNGTNDTAKKLDAPLSEHLLNDAGFAARHKNVGAPAEVKIPQTKETHAALSWLPTVHLIGDQETKQSSAKERLLQRYSQESKDPKDSKDEKKTEVHSKEFIEITSLTPEKLQEIKAIKDAQSLISKFAELLPLSQQQQTDLKNRIQKEAGETDAAKTGYEKLPTFGLATQEGYQKLVATLEKNAVPNAINNLKNSQIEMPTGFPLRLPSNNQELPATADRIIAETLSGKGSLTVHTDKVDEQDVTKIEGALDWLKRAEEAVEKKAFDRRFDAVRKQVEGDSNLAETQFPKGWAYKDGMDKHAWCAAAERAMATYARVTSVIEALNYLQRTGENFKTDGLNKANLPTGMKLEYDKSGNIKTIDYADLLIPNLVLEKESNSGKLEAINAYADKYEKLAVTTMNDRFRAGDFKNVYAYGEQEVPNGWYNAETKQIKQSETNPGQGWTHFNLITHNLTVKNVKDELQPDAMISVTNDVKCKDVPAYAYLNVYGAEVAHPEGKETIYKPDDFVAVQNSSGKIEMVQAKHLDNWLNGIIGEKAKYWGGKTMTVAMDAGMVVSGVTELRAGYQASKLTAEGFIKLAANETVKLAAEDIPKNLASKLLRKGALEIALGGSGVFTSNAASHESTTLSGIGHVRSMYFMAQAGKSLLTSTLTTKIGSSIRDAVVDKSITEFAGRMEASQTVLEQAKTALLDSSKGWSTTAKLAKHTFSAADTLFLISSLNDARELWRTKNEPVNLRFLETAQSKLLDSTKKESDDPRLLAANAAMKAARDKMAGEAKAPGQDQLLVSQQAMQTEQAVAALHTFQKTLKTPANDATLTSIVDKTSTFLRTTPSEEARTKFIAEELMSHLKFDGTKIHKLEHDYINNLNVAQINEIEKNDTSLQQDKQKLAGLAALLVGTKADGSLPDVLAERTIVVPPRHVVTLEDDYTELPAANLKQELNSDRIIKLLTSDKQSATTVEERMNKTESLYRAGIVSSESYGSTLLGVLDNKSASTREQKFETIARLNTLITSMKAIEAARTIGFAADQITSAQGKSFGLSSSDLIQGLSQAAKNFTDADLKASARYALNVLDRKNLDVKDIDDLNKKYSKAPPVVTEEEFQTQLKAALTLPEKPEAADWERKLQAAATLHEMGGEVAKVRQAFNDCLSSENASVALDTMIKLTAKQSDNRTLLDDLYKGDAKGRANTANKIGHIASDMPGNLTDINADESKQSELIQERVRFVKALPEILASGMDEFGIDSNIVSLQHLIQTEGTPHADSPDQLHADSSEQVRAAAITTLANLGTTNGDRLQAIQNCMDISLESAPSVRLAAVEAMEQLHRFTELKSAASKLALHETDPAVLSKFRNYFEASGDKSNNDSLASKAEVEKNIDALTNKTVITAKQAAESLNSVYGQLQRKDDFQAYVYADKQEHSEALKLYDERVQDFRNHLSKNDWLAEYATNDLINLELRAQHQAVTKYQENLNTLVADAKSNTDQTIVSGKLVPRNEVAMAALGMLLQLPDQLTDSFSRHKENQNGKDGYREYTAAELAQRSKMAEQLPNSYDLGAFTKEPWKEAQTQAAKALRDICESGEIPVKSKLLKEQILNGLNSQFADPAAKVELLKGLDALMSRSDTLISAKEEIMTVIHKHLSEETDKNLSLALIEMSAKHERATFAKFSDSDNNVRGKLRALVSSAADIEVRERATDTLAKNWEAVKSIKEQLPLEANSTNPLLRASLLPDPLNNLLKSSNGSDKAVDDAVTAIVRASKGCPLTHDDPRREALSKLTDADLDGKVRLAAAMTLSASPDEADRIEALNTIANIAADANKTGLRREALQALDKVSVRDSVIAAGSLDFAIGELQSKMTAEFKQLHPNAKLQSADTQQLIDAVHALNEKPKDNQLLQDMDKLAACLTRKADLQLKQGGEDKDDAIKTLKMALSIYDVNPDSFSKIRITTFDTPDYEQFQKEFEKLPSGTTSTDRGQLANCLKEYAKISVTNLNKDNYESSRAAILTSLQMSERVTDSALPKGSIESATAKAQAADIYKHLAIFERQIERNSSAVQNFSSAQARYEKAGAEFASYQKEHPNDTDINKLAAMCTEQGQNCQLKRLGAMADSVMKDKLGAKSFGAALLLRDLSEAEQKIEQQQKQDLSGTIAFRLATVNWLSARITEGTTRANHYNKAEAELQKSINLFSQEGRKVESANAQITLRELHKEAELMNKIK